MKNLKSLLAVSALLMATVFFNQECQSQTQAPSTPAAPAAAAPAAGGASGIKGKVTFAGVAKPAMPKLKREADPFCGKTPMTDEEVIVNANNTLKNVVVRVVKGAPAGVAPATPVTVDQSNCMYRPRVSGAVVGQKWLIKNSDPVMHNIHAYVGATTAFNQAQTKGSKDMEKVVASGVTKTKCDVHPWMTGYVVGNDNPYIAVTGDSGEFTLANVPAGTYTVEAWHEKYGTKTVDVTVAAGQTATADFALGQ